MSDVTLSWLGKTITIMDNGDGTLGDGDRVYVYYLHNAPLGKTYPINDGLLAEELRNAGVELAKFQGLPLANLERFFKAMDNIYSNGLRENEKNITEAKTLAGILGISTASTPVQLMFRAIVERYFESLLWDFDLRCSKESMVEKFGKVQKLAIHAGMEFPSEQASAANLHMLVANACVTIADLASTPESAKKLLDKGRYHAQQAGVRFDEQKAAAILGSFAERKCGSDPKNPVSIYALSGRCRMEDPDILRLGAARCYYRLSPDNDYKVELVLPVGLML